MSMAYLLTLLSALSSIIGNVSAKYWADRMGIRWIVLTTIAYVTATLLYVWSLRLGKFTILNALFYSLVPMITIVSGFLLFKEKLTQIQIAGLVLALAGVALFTLEEGLFVGR